MLLIFKVCTALQLDSSSSWQSIFRPGKCNGAAESRCRPAKRPNYGHTTTTAALAKLRTLDSHGRNARIDDLPCGFLITIRFYKLNLLSRFTNRSNRMARLAAIALNTEIEFRKVTHISFASFVSSLTGGQSPPVACGIRAIEICW